MVTAFPALSEFPCAFLGFLCNPVSTGLSSFFSPSMFLCINSSVMPGLEPLPGPVFSCTVGLLLSCQLCPFSMPLASPLMPAFYWPFFAAPSAIPPVLLVVRFSALPGLSHSSSAALSCWEGVHNLTLHHAPITQKFLSGFNCEIVGDYVEK